MLQSWTQIDIKELVGSNINSRASALYMTGGDHRAFGQFRFYFYDDLLLLMPMHSSIWMFLISTGCGWLEMDTG